MNFAKKKISLLDRFNFGNSSFRCTNEPSGPKLEGFLAKIRHRLKANKQTARSRCSSSAGCRVFIHHAQFIAKLIIVDFLENSFQFFFAVPELLMRFSHELVIKVAWFMTFLRTGLLAAISTVCVCKVWKKCNQFTISGFCLL